MVEILLGITQMALSPMFLMPMVVVLVINLLWKGQDFLMVGNFSDMPEYA